MGEHSNRWSEVGERLEALALKLHFEQTGRGEEVPDAIHKFRNSVSEAFEAARNAVRDRTDNLNDKTKPADPALESPKSVDHV